MNLRRDFSGPGYDGMQYSRTSASFPSGLQGTVFDEKGTDRKGSSPAFHLRQLHQKWRGAGGVNNSLLVRSFW